MEQFDTVNSSAKPCARPTQTARDLIRCWFSSRLGLTMGGTTIVAAGLVLGWNWLTAVGLAPLILTLAPCAIMCALGLCMMPRGNSPSATQSSVEQAKPPEPASTLTQSGGQGA